METLNDCQASNVSYICRLMTHLFHTKTLAMGSSEIVNISQPGLHRPKKWGDTNLIMVGAITLNIGYKKDNKITRFFWSFIWIHSKKIKS